MAKVDREELLAVLSDAAPALAKTGTIKERAHYWIDGSKVTSYDGGLGIQLKLPIDTGLHCGLPGKTLTDLLKTSSIVEVELTSKGDDVVLKLGKARMTLAALDPDRDSWPFPKTGKGDGVSIELTEALLASLGKLMFVKPSKQEHPLHGGVVVLPDNKGMVLLVTDSKTIAQCAVDQKNVDCDNVLLPWAFVRALLDLVKPGAILCVTDDYLMVEQGSTRVCSNKLEFPTDYDVAERVDFYLDAVEKLAPIELPGEIKLMLDRARILAGGEVPKVEVGVDGSKLSVSGSWPLGAIDEELTLKKAAKNAATVLFDANLIDRGLAHVKSFKLTSDLFAFYGEGSDDFLYLVAPLQMGAKKETAEGEAMETEKKPRSKKTKASAAEEEGDKPRKPNKDAAEDEDLPSTGRRRSRDAEASEGDADGSEEPEEQEERSSRRRSRDKDEEEPEEQEDRSSRRRSRDKDEDEEGEPEERSSRRRSRDKDEEEPEEQEERSTRRSRRAA